MLSARSKSNNARAVPPVLSDRQNALDKALIESTADGDKHAMQIFLRTAQSARLPLHLVSREE
jgi:hypothetical protein